MTEEKELKEVKHLSSLIPFTKHIYLTPQTFPAYSVKVGIRFEI